MAPSAEISRLSALITKDPRSKLFVPLAEEYMKAGMTDQAVKTLERGLLANPYYMSARVMLGKARLEQGETDMAREEFELVVKAVPDNLFAHRKLGEIYWQQGRRTEAARALRMVTILNPKDEEARRLIELLESGAMPATGTPVEAPEGTAKPHSDVETAVEAAQSPHQEEPEPQAFDISEPEETEPEEPEPEPEQQPEPEPAVMEMPVPEMDTLPVVEVAQLAEGGIEEEHIAEAAPVLEAEPLMEEEPAAVMLAEEEPSEAVPAYTLDISGDTGLDEILSAYSEPAATEEVPEDTSEAGGVYEISEDLSAFEIEGLVVKAPQGAVEDSAPKDVFETRTLAELYCTQGFYDRAIAIYKNLLSDDPDNREIKAKLEEIYWRAGVATAGAAAEAKEYPAGANGEKIRRLEQFLEAVKRKAGR